MKRRKYHQPDAGKNIFIESSKSDFLVLAARREQARERGRFERERSFREREVVSRESGGCGGEGEKIVELFAKICSMMCCILFNIVSHFHIRFVLRNFRDGFTCIQDCWLFDHKGMPISYTADVSQYSGSERVREEGNICFAAY